MTINGGGLVDTRGIYDRNNVRDAAVAGLQSSKAHSAQKEQSHMTTNTATSMTIHFSSILVMRLKVI
jgi:hypothetical protein